MEGPSLEVGSRRAHSSGEGHGRSSNLPAPWPHQPSQACEVPSVALPGRPPFWISQSRGPPVTGRHITSCVCAEAEPAHKVSLLHAFPDMSPRSCFTKKPPIAKSRNLACWCVGCACLVCCSGLLPRKKFAVRTEFPRTKREERERERERESERESERLDIEPETDFAFRQSVAWPCGRNLILNTSGLGADGVQASQERKRV